eukprot:TRINITY_DN315_c0_g1_i2.p1 TRINITY_DN315_c0_g1~~TRINITY_DN315_c0_g1_i2.p1  ORF type:complete len:387 (+),score=45.00 TRINITY_DN315_c0_g1_i2:219-1379(+)
MGESMSPHLPFCNKSLVNDTVLKYLGRKCWKIHSLDISYCHLVTEDGLAHLIQRCAVLEKLKLASLMISREGLEKIFSGPLELSSTQDQTDGYNQDVTTNSDNNSSMFSRIRSSTINLLQLKMLSLPVLARLDTKPQTATQTLKDNHPKMQSPRVHRQLVELNLTCCRSIDDSALNVISTACPSLQTIYLGGCPFTSPSGISMLLTQCKNIRDLFIPGHVIADEGLELILEACPLLETLSLCRVSGLTQRGFNMIGDKCRALLKLYLTATGVTNDSLKHLADQLSSSLEVLELAACSSINMEGVSYLLSSLTKLKRIDLAHCTVGNIFKSVAVLDTVEVLDLSNAFVANLNGIRDCTSLKVVYFIGSRLSAKDIEQSGYTGLSILR